MSTKEPSAKPGELTIRSLASTKRGNVQLTFENGKTVTITQEAYLSSFLYPGKTLTQGEWDAIQRVNGQGKGLAYAEGLLAKRPYGRLELVDKLMRVKKLTYPEAQLILETVAKEGLLDEVGYAQDLALEYQAKGFSRSAIESKLEAKKLPTEAVEAGLKSLGPDPVDDLVKDCIGFVRSHPDDSYLMLSEKLKGRLGTKGYFGSQADAILDRLKLDWPEFTSQERENLALKKAIAKVYARLELKKGGDVNAKAIKALMAKGFAIADIKDYLRKEGYSLD